MRERGAAVDRSAAALLAAAILLAFGLAFWAGWIYDDAAYLLSNPEVVGRWLGLRHWLTATLPGTREYEPLPVLLHRALFAVFGARAAPFRAVNLLLHWVNALLVLALYARLTGSRRAALPAALLFALFPGHAEVVAMATFKKHLLVALCALLTLQTQWRRAWPAWGRAAAGAALLAAGLLCKESALLIPLLCLLVAAAENGGFIAALRRDGALYGAMAATALAFAVWRGFVVPREYPAPLGGGWDAHLLTVLKCLAWDARELLLPFWPSLEQGLSPVAAAGALRLCGALLAVAAAGAGGAWLWRRDRVLGLSAAWTAATLLPFSNLVPFANFSLVADRYLYLASAGLFLAAARLFQRLDERRPLGARLSWGAALAAPLALGYVAVDTSYLALFHDPVALWTRGVGAAPRNPRAHAELGAAYRDREDYADAERELSEGLALSTGTAFGATVAVDLAGVYAQEGKTAQAIALGEDAARQKPTARALNNLAVFYLQAGQDERARPLLERALSLSPGDPAVLENLSKLRAPGAKPRSR